MKGDFSRLTFDARKHYNSVRMQQGRVQLDADWNEQSDIVAHQLAALRLDAFGLGGAPITNPGFEITPLPEAADAGLPDFMIGAGHYYVDGILCENEEPVLFSAQPDYPDAASRDSLPVPDHYLAYLDVWMREVNAIEDPDTVEVALGGPDTAVRLKTVWQVKLLPLDDPHSIPTDLQDFRDVERLPAWQQFVADQARYGRLDARYVPAGMLLDNHLYRVEIHQDAPATFKWSRDNASVVFAITDVSHKSADSWTTLTIKGLDRDGFQLRPGDWVEISEDNAVLNNRPWPLRKVIDVDPAHGQALIEGAWPLHNPQAVTDFLAAHPLLRRWDHQGSPDEVDPADAIPLTEGEWLDLENGIQVNFAPGGTYRPGDYWLIPSRSVADGLTGNIAWPPGSAGLPGQPPFDAVHDYSPPSAVVHHYSPLAVLRREPDAWQTTGELRPLFKPVPHITRSVRDVETDVTTIVKEMQELRDNLAAMQTDVLKTEMLAAKLGEEVYRLKEAVALERIRLTQDFVCHSTIRVGDVVALDPQASQAVMRAHRGNQKLVIGVVVGDTDPYRADQVRVALYGRVQCHVVGRIEPGDLLVPSYTDGCARARGWLFFRGAVIGKALGGHEPGMQHEPGLIDALVTLA